MGESRTRKIILAAAGLATASFLVMVVLSYRTFRSLDVTAGLVQHTNAVRDAVDEAQLQLKDLQTGERGFILSGDDRFLARFEQGAAGLGPALERLRAETKDNTRQQGRLDLLQAALPVRVAEMRRLHEIRQSQGLAAMAGPAEALGPHPLERITRTLAEMKAEEDRLLAARLAAARHGAARIATAQAASLGLAGLLLLVAAALLRRWLAENERALALDRLARTRDEQLDRQFRALFESIPGHFLVLRPDLKIAAASDAYLAATMTKRDEILGRDLFEVFPDNPDDPAANGMSNLRASLERVRSGGASDTMAIQKYDLRRRDGSFEERYWAPVNSPVFGSDRRIEYLIHRVEDVTEFVRAKAKSGNESPQMQAQLEAMEATVYQRSQEAQAALDQLRIANEELEAFSYSVSHDLRAPLRHIAGFADMLGRQAPALDDKGRHYLKTIADAAQRMGQLIDDLLTFSRIGRVELRRTTVDPTALVEEVRQGLVPEINGRTVRWNVSPLPPIQADPSLFRQVLANLLGNAVKYTRGRPEARIEVGTLPAPAGETILFVRDNGAGFDMKYADKLFGVFQRLHSSSDFEGTGVGLANVRRIVVRHGGRVWAEGKVGEGAVFFLALPQLS